jgi:hypothetical protein
MDVKQGVRDDACPSCTLPDFAIGFRNCLGTFAGPTGEGTRAVARTTMKIRMLTVLFAAALLLGGCSSMKFTAYQVSGVFQGKGGIEREVDGVDFWEDGEPGRKYKILGLIEQSHGQRLPLGLGRLTHSSSGSGDHDSAIAKLAHKKGGDAVIILIGNEEGFDAEDDSGRHHRRHRKIVVIKYVE